MESAPSFIDELETPAPLIKSINLVTTVNDDGTMDVTSEIETPPSRRGMVFFDNKSEGQDIHYIEATILEGPETDVILGIGFFNESVVLSDPLPSYPRGGMVGWYKGSIGYHADDGGVFWSRGGHDKHWAVCDVGDTMGVGINCRTREVIFTKNGDVEGVLPFDHYGAARELTWDHLVPSITISHRPKVVGRVACLGITRDWDMFQYQDLMFELAPEEGSEVSL
eukprot:gnl/Dysnectes_brevis/2653_a3210_2181.p1 GENE.gnl/Dysnectes_brevis/2653_a3210_2181~~gnl/Dysnectes_brevis/2653_a3210_2181.p1  ORF type:complete len:255 (+),score=29.89 gnl/Dysnectes_brevis/2653_a3210_2181:94-765(+)